MPPLRSCLLLLTLFGGMVGCGSAESFPEDTTEPAPRANFGISQRPAPTSTDAGRELPEGDASRAPRDQVDIADIERGDSPMSVEVDGPSDAGAEEGPLDGALAEVEAGPTPAPCDTMMATVWADRLEGPLPLTVTFTATSPCETAPLGSALWTFGEGEATQSGAEAQFTFLKSGEQSVTLTLSDEEGGISTTSLSIKVLEGLCPESGETLKTGTLPFDALEGSSGLGASLDTPEVLWTLGDSGSPATLFATTPSGQALGAFPLEGAQNIDWEDITLGRGEAEGASWIYVWDGGDNEGERDEVQVLMVEEPSLAFMNASPTAALPWSMMTLVYPDGVASNSDSLLFDPQSGDLLVVAKVPGATTSQVFRKSAPHLAETTTTLTWIADLTFGQAPLAGADYPTAGAFSPLGDRLMLRTDNAAFLWLRDGAKTLEESLNAPPCAGPFAVQSKGEGISFDSVGDGYFDVSDATHGKIRYTPFIEPEVCLPPEVDILLSPLGPYYAPVTLSFAPDPACMVGEISQLSWTINDLTIDEHAPTLSFEGPQSVSVTLTVWDSAGGISQRTESVEILAPPCATLSTTETLGSVEEEDIDEASGVVMSSQNEGVLWVHNDSGDTPRLFALDLTGEHLGTWTLLTVPKDWEDLAYGYDEALGAQALYVGDIGDNATSRSEITVYVVPEPVLDSASEPGDQDVESFSSLTLTYPEGVAHNCETLMRDPLNGDLYLVVKSSDGKSPVFRKAAPHIDGSKTELEWVADLAFGSPPLSGSASTTAGAFSPSGDKIIIRTYSSAYLWFRQEGQSVAQALEGPPCDVQAPDEPQGEAICFSADGAGYITISEGTNQPIYYTGLD